MEKQCSVLILPQAKPKTILQQCSQYGTFHKWHDHLSGGKEFENRGKMDELLKLGQGEGRFKKWKKTTVHQKSVLEFAPLGNYWRIKTAVLSMWWSGPSCAWAWVNLAIVFCLPDESANHNVTGQILNLPFKMIHTVEKQSIMDG